MLLTTCAACAAPQPHIAKQCSRCKTRYCGPACQKQHWDAAGGHKDICRKIKKGGGAEQYHADKKYKEAVAVAVEKCRGRHEGQKCYICLEAVHPHTGEGLVRGCACGDRDGVSSPELGVAHVSCLARQAKILCDEAKENNLGRKAEIARWERWCTCSLCNQDYHGVVRCALGWACWKTYVGRPEADEDRIDAMTNLGNGLSEEAVSRYPEALAVYEANLALLRRLGRSEDSETILVMQTNIAYTLSLLGRDEEALELERTIYRQRMASRGIANEHTIRAALNLSVSLSSLERFEEARTIAQKTIPVVQRTFGPDHDLTLCIRRNFVDAVSNDPKSTLADLRRAETTLKDVYRRTRRVFGCHHPETRIYEKNVKRLKAILAERNSGGG
jgi:tetratricopeptide (TPR) repeat protein